MSLARYRSLRRIPPGVWTFALTAIGVALVPVMTGGDFAVLNAIANIAVLGIAVLGMNLVLGVAGQFWAGQSALFAIGAYLCAILTTRNGLSFWVAAPLAALVTGIVGTFLGLPGLRLGGFYLALSTFFLASLVPLFALTFQTYTGGYYGVVGIPSPSIGSLTFDILGLYGLCVITLGIVFLANYSLLRSQWGRILQLVAHDENVAASVGVRLWKVKLVVYFAGALIVGAAGAIFAPVNLVVVPDQLGISLSIFLLAAVVVGGTGTLAGPILGVFLLRVLPMAVTDLQKFSLIIYGIVLFAVMLVAPRGLLPSGRALFHEVIARTWRRARGAADSHAQVPRLKEGGNNLGAPLSPDGRSSGGGTIVGELFAAGPLRDTRAASQPMLLVQHVSKSFGGVRALVDVNLEAPPGHLCAIIGPNGSGKTTLLNIVSGFYRSDSGAVLVGGVSTLRLRPHIIASRLGVRRSFQTAAVVPDLTVLENALLGFGMPTNTFVASCLGWPRMISTERRLRSRALSVLEFVGLSGVANMQAKNLPAGNRRLLEIARSLVSLPQLLLLDEPSAGLSPVEISELATVIKAVCGLGVTAVVVEHNMNFVMRHATSIVILDHGSVVAVGPPEVIGANEDVVRAYVGTRSRK